MKKTKRIALIVLSLVMLLSFTACAERDPNIPDGFLLAENEGADFFFYYPQAWLLDRHDAGMTSVYYSNQDFSNVSVTAFTLNNEIKDLEDYAENYYFKQFQDHFQNLTVERNPDGSLKRENLKIDECDALATKYTATFAGEEYSFRIWFISYNGYIYTVLYTAKTPVYEMHLAEANAMANAIQFK